MTGWWRDFGAARFGRPVAPRPIVRAGLLARLDRAFGEPAVDPSTVPPAGPASAGPARQPSDRASSGEASSGAKADGVEADGVEAGGVEAGGAGRVAGRKPVVVVAAGSGAGKSVLLAQWAERRRAVVVRAGETPVPGVGEVPGGTVVVVDGVERLGGAWGRVVELVGVVPLVLSGREAAPVSADDRLGAGDLAFAEDETYQVLAAALADAAGADGLAPDLHLLTGGWPALVGLAAAWLARLPPADRAGSLRQLARVDEELREHLVGALITVLHVEERELVRRLAHLPAVDAATADALDLTEDLGGLPPIVMPVIGRRGFYAVPEPLREMVQQRLPLDERERQALLDRFQGM